MNSIQVIFPYKIQGIWVFDDIRVGLSREPFVGEVNDFLDVLVAKIPNAAGGFVLTFSDTAFPGYGMKLNHVRPEFEGNWYECEEVDNRQGWLCASLLKYFTVAPKSLFIEGSPAA